MPGQLVSYVIDQGVRCFDVCGVEAFETLLSRRLVPARVISRATAEAIRVSGTYGVHEGIEFSRIKCIGDIVVVPQRPFDGIVFIVPLAGRSIVRDADNLRIGTHVSGICVDGTAWRSVEFASGGTYYLVAIPHSQVVERLAVLLERPIVQTPIFKPFVDRSTTGLRMLMALIDFATGPSFGPSLYEGALAAKRPNDMLVDLIHETWPHNYSKLLSHPSVAVVPRYVRLAIDFVAERPAADIDSAQLAALGEVSVRALQAGFRRFVGKAIAAYQRQARLERAREELFGNPMSAVEEVARNWGFTNAGRFSRYFREVYGISPPQVRGWLNDASRIAEPTVFGARWTSPTRGLFEAPRRKERRRSQSGLRINLIDREGLAKPTSANQSDRKPLPSFCGGSVRRFVIAGSGG